MRTDALEAIQTRLQALGWYTGQVDGQDGPLTSMAVTDFKKASDLNPRDLIGEITLTRLFAPDAARRKAAAITVGQFPWVTEARRLLGTKETLGKASNPVIMDWAKDLDIAYSGDDVAWCGLFVAHCMKVGAPLDPQNFNRLSSRAWGDYGRAVQPCYGAIVTFWRGSRDGWTGHVGILIGEDATAWQIIGGNQSDSVSITRMAKDRALAFRFPKSFNPGANKLLNVIGGKLSTNEA